MSNKQYGDRDVIELDRLGGHFTRHVSAMTSEGLHDKHEIAEELAFRDAEIERLNLALGNISRDAPEKNVREYAKACMTPKRLFPWVSNA